MTSIENYVEDLFDGLPDSDRKEQLRGEITENLKDKVRDLVAQGKAEEDAVNKAIVEFGDDISDIRTELAAQQREPDKKKKPAGLALGFSLWGSALIIALVVFINLYYTPGTIWCVFPIFAVLWWPLAMFFHWLSVRRR